MPQLQQHAAFPLVAAPRRAGAIGALGAAIGLACDAREGMAERVRAALERAAAEPDLLSAGQRETCAGCYARHVLYSDPLGRFTVLAIVWDAGQFSPPHAHETWCAYAVHDGSLHETLYAFDQTTAKANPVCTKVRDPGYSCFAGAGLDQVHRLGNAGATPAISIHVYGVGRERVCTHVNRVLEVGDKRGPAV